MFDEKKNFILICTARWLIIRTDENMPDSVEHNGTLLLDEGAHYDEAEFHEAYSGALRKAGCQGSGKRHSEGIEIDLCTGFQRASLQTKGSRAVSSEVELLRLHLEHFHSEALSFPDALMFCKLRKDGVVFLFTNAQAAFTIPELESLDIMECSKECRYLCNREQKPSKKFSTRAIKNTGINAKESGRSETTNSRYPRRYGSGLMHAHSDGKCPTVAHNLPAFHKVSANFLDKVMEVSRGQV